jgi:hypothetical protein
MKRCSKCKRMRPLEDFTRSRASADGRYSSCRTCKARTARGELVGDESVAEVGARDRAERLWGMLSDEGKARVARELERNTPQDVDAAAELGTLDAA